MGTFTKVLIAAVLAVALFGLPFGGDGGQGPLGPGVASADTGFPATINARWENGVLTVSGTYSFPQCPQSKKANGFAIFVNGATPASPGTGALDGQGAPNTMHPVNMVNYEFPCLVSGNWGPDTHPLAQPPSVACVVIYDVHDSKLPPATGNHSTVGAGSNRNTDNSFDKGIGPGMLCTPPIVPTPTPTVTSTFTPTLTPTLTATNTPTRTATITPTHTATHTPTHTATNTPTRTATNTPVGTATNTPVGTATITPTSTPAPGQGRITIVEETDPDGAAGFTFSGSLGTFTLNDDQSIGFNVNAGTFTVTQTGQPGGFQLAGVACTDPTGGTTTNATTASATIGVVAGDAITCTFTNNQPPPPPGQGTITIILQTNPSGGGGFSFSGTLGAFVLNDGQSANFTRGAGTYTVTLSGLPSGWLLSAISCTDPTGNTTTSVTTLTASIGLAAGDAVVCVFDTRISQVSPIPPRELPRTGDGAGGSWLPWPAVFGGVLAVAAMGLIVGALRSRPVPQRDD